jgi:feruloyl esterase
MKKIARALKYRAHLYVAVVVFAVLMMCAPSFGEDAATTPSCESLAKLALPNTAIVASQVVAAGQLAMTPAAVLPPSAQAALGPQTGPGAPAGRTPGTDFSKLPAICRVQATVKPSPDDVAKLEVWLPMTGWNGSSITVTHPSSAGGNVNTEVVNAVQNGYAALLNLSPSFDDWATAAKSSDRLLDQGYRTGHAMLVAAKAILNTFYGSPVKHAYYEGCSEGGREGFNAAHHYPNDYDAISVGGSGNQFAKINAAQMYPAWIMSKTPGSFIPAQKWVMIHKAALDACDEIDGVKDRIIEDPRQCNFKPESLLCKGAETDNCLNAPQVEALKATYKGTVNPRTGEVIFPGPPPGGELPVFEFANPDVPMKPAHLLYQALVFGDKPNWDWKTLDMDKDVALAIQKVGPALHTTPADLKDFVDHGGKMIIWDGWNDYNSPNYWIDYYTEMQKLFGADKVAKSVQLYFLPGVQHCGGGEGADTFSKLGALSEWIEAGKPPASIPASHVEKGTVTFTRPVCPYPQVPNFKGTGDVNDAANWVCKATKAGR